MSKDAYWFSHDSNAKDDPKCMLLIDQLGLEGYGIYWVLVETLREQPEYRYPIRLLHILAKRYSTSGEKMLAVVKNYALFEIEDDEFFFSDSLNKRMKHLAEKREQRRLAAHARWDKEKGKDADAMRPHSDRTADAMLSKVKKSKEEDIGARKQKLYQQVANYKDKYSGNMLRDFYDYWTETNQGGKKMRFEMEKTWELGRRLAKWERNESKFGGKQKEKYNPHELKM